MLRTETVHSPILRSLRPIWLLLLLELLAAESVASARPDWCQKAADVGMARWLASGYCPERPVWLGDYDRVLLTPAICADVPPPARASGQPDAGERAKSRQIAPLASSDDAEARCAASRRCGGFAQSCGRRRSFDQGRSDPCARHQHGSCGRRFVHLVRFCAESSW